MARLYVDSTVSASGDGRSWRTAFATIAEAAAAITPGDDLYLNAPPAIPLKLDETLVLFQNSRVIGDEGPDGVAWIDMTIDTATLTGLSGSIQSWNTGGIEPDSVAFNSNYRRDDVVGTTTGVRANDPRIQWQLKRLGGWLKPSDIRPFFGWSRRNTSTPTSPGPGEWGYASGTVYTNTADGVSSIKMAPNGLNGMVVNGTGSCLFKGLRFFGAVGYDGNGGYFIKIQNGSGSRIVECIGYESGWHAFGAASDQDGDNQCIRCASIQQSANDSIVTPFIFYIDQNSEADNGNIDCGCVDCFDLACPTLDVDGKPLNADRDGDWSQESHAMVYAHTDGIATAGGLFGRNCHMFSVTAMLEAKHGETYTINQRFDAIIKASSQPAMDDDADYRDPATYASWIEECSAFAEIIPVDGTNVRITRCHMDGMGFGNAEDQVWRVDQDETRCLLEETFLRTPSFGVSYARAIDNDDRITLRGCTVIANKGGDATEAALFRMNITSVSHTGYENLAIEGCLFDAVDAPAEIALLISTNPTVYNDAFPGVVDHGGNAICNGFDGSAKHNNPSVAVRDFDWYRSNIAGQAATMQSPAAEAGIDGAGAAGLVIPILSSGSAVRSLDRRPSPDRVGVPGLIGGRGSDGTPGAFAATVSPEPYENAFGTNSAGIGLVTGSWGVGGALLALTAADSGRVLQGAICPAGNGGAQNGRLMATFVGGLNASNNSGPTLLMRAGVSPERGVGVRILGNTTAGATVQAVYVDGGSITEIAELATGLAAGGNLAVGLAIAGNQMAIFYDNANNQSAGSLFMDGKQIGSIDLAAASVPAAAYAGGGPLAGFTGTAAAEVITFIRFEPTPGPAGFTLPARTHAQVMAGRAAAIAAGPPRRG